MRFRSLILLLALCLLPALASAQTPVPSPTPATTQLAWNHDGVNLDGFALYVDGTRSDVGLPTRQPDGSYRIPFPALTPGNHTLEVAAYNLAGESTRITLTVTVVVVPAPPTGLRIVQ